MIQQGTEGLLKRIGPDRTLSSVVYLVIVLFQQNKTKHKSRRG